MTRILVALGLVVAAIGATWIGARRQQRALAANVGRLVRASENSALSAARRLADNRWRAPQGTARP